MIIRKEGRQVGDCEYTSPGPLPGSGQFAGDGLSVDFDEWAEWLDREVAAGRDPVVRRPAGRGAAGGAAAGEPRGGEEGPGDRRVRPPQGGRVQAGGGAGRARALPAGTVPRRRARDRAAARAGPGLARDR